MEDTKLTYDTTVKKHNTTSKLRKSKLILSSPNNFGKIVSVCIYMACKFEQDKKMKIFGHSNSMKFDKDFIKGNSNNSNPIANIDFKTSDHFQVHI